VDFPSDSGFSVESQFPVTKIPTYIPIDDCLKQRAKDWPQHIGVGHYAEIHHSPCFRIYNLDLEMRFRKYSIGKSAVADLEQEYLQVRE